MEDSKPRLNMTAIEIQQEYYETIGDADWELFEKKDRKYLLQKVAVALCGPPSHEGNLMDSVEDTGSGLKLQGYEARDEETCMKVFNKILEQDKYSHNGENLIISILRVVCVIPSREIKFFEITPYDYWVNLQYKKGESVHILVFHVFSIRKCISMNPDVKGCRVFIDHDARVYETWRDFLTENKLPKCVMVVPENGIYKGVIRKDGDTPEVKLTIRPSPELGLGAKVLNVTDTASTVANVGALVAIVGSLAATPVVAPVMVGTAIGVGAVTGIYGIGRSIAHLVDRGTHEQSIALDNSEARSSWLNIMISTVGLSFTTAGKLLTWAAASGRNVKVLMSALEFLKYTNLATGFVGVANGLGDMIIKYAKYGETPSTTEVFQFTTSALFLGIGVMSNQTAQEIVHDAQANKINEIRDSLSSNNKRKIFDKVTAETRRVRGTIQGNTDVIRALEKIKNKDDFFGKLRNINKSVNENKVRISLNPDGRVLINNQYKQSVSSMYRIGEEGRNNLFARYGRANVTTRNAPTRIYASGAVANASNLPITELILSIRPEEIIKISGFLISLSKADQDFVLELLSLISGQCHDGFLLICTELIIKLIPIELDFIESICPNWKRRLISFVFNYLKSKITIDEDDSEFTAGLKSFIRDGRIHEQTLLRLKEKLMEHFSKLKKDKDSRNKTWKEGDDYSSKYLISFNTLQVGQKIIVGPHTILVKQITVESFEMWFLKYSEQQCVFFTELCFKIISLLTNEEVGRLNAINPDEDIIMRVLLFIHTNFDSFFGKTSTVDTHLTLLAKYEILQWARHQILRTQHDCRKCKGITYFKKS